MFLTLLLEHWRAVLATLLLATLLGLLAYRGLEIASLQRAQAALKTALQASQASVVQLRTALDEQNAAVDALKHAADVQLAQHQQALAAAKSTRIQANLAAQQLLQMPMQLGQNACKSADDLINEQIK